MRAERSGRQLLAALAAASGEDGATGPGAHPQPEAVGLRAATVVRLESTLAHGWAPGLMVRRKGAVNTWMACQGSEGTRNSRRVTSRPSYVTGEAPLRSNWTGYPPFHRRLFHRRPCVHSMCTQVPLGCGQCLEHSCAHRYCRPFRSRSWAVHNLWISCGGPGHEVRPPRCGRSGRRSPRAAAHVDKRSRGAARGRRGTAP